MIDGLRHLLDTRFGGVLKQGAHEEDGECCVVELLAAAKGLPWTNNPYEVGCWDLRSINDILVSDEIRTQYLLPVAEIYHDSRSWPVERQIRVVQRLAIMTVQRLISAIPGLPALIRQACQDARDLQEARGAAKWAKRSATSLSESSGRRVRRRMRQSRRDAAEQAEDASWAARDALWSAVWSSSAADVALAVVAARSEPELNAVFIATCQLWIEAAQED